MVETRGLRRRHRLHFQRPHRFFPRLIPPPLDSVLYSLLNSFHDHSFDPALDTALYPSLDAALYPSLDAALDSVLYPFLASYPLICRSAS